MDEKKLRTDTYQTYPASHANRYVGNDIFGLYRHDIKRYPILRDKQEVANLSRQVQAGKAARKELESADELPPSKRRRLAQIAQEGVEARNSMLLGNTGLAFELAKRRAGHGVDKLDLLQEANIAIMNAAETFNPDKGAFSSHASLRIRAELADAVSEQGRSIRIPNYHSAKLQQMRIIQEDKESKNVALTDEELATAMKVDVDYLHELQMMEWPTHSLNYVMEGADDGHVTETGELISDPMAPSVEDIVIGTDDEQAGRMAEALREALLDSDLTEKERAALWLRYAEGQSSISAAETMGVSKSTAEKLATQALQKFRLEMEAKGGLDYLKTEKPSA